jgi:hypothetical protein
MGEDPSCEYVPAGNAIITADMPIDPEAPVDWTPEAKARLSKVPLFLRPVIKKKLEARARAEGVPVTAELMARHRAERERDLGLKFK